MKSIMHFFPKHPIKRLCLFVLANLIFVAFFILLFLLLDSKSNDTITTLNIIFFGLMIGLGYASMNVIPFYVMIYYLDKMPQKDCNDYMKASWFLPIIPTLFCFELFFDFTFSNLIIILATVLCIGSCSYLVGGLYYGLECWLVPEIKT